MADKDNENQAAYEAMPHDKLVQEILLLEEMWATSSRTVALMSRLFVELIKADGINEIAKYLERQAFSGLAITDAEKKLFVKAVHQEVVAQAVDAVFGPNKGGESND